jgi:mono/diheme cytochrome c family protein
VRRIVLIAAGLVCASVLAACQSQGVGSATPATVIGTVGSSYPTVPASKLTGDATNGKTIFAAQSCGGCHTLAAAHSTGTIGPNLDQLKPDYHDTTAQVTIGGAPMPAYKGTLTDQQIADVAAYVVTSTGGTAP